MSERAIVVGLDGSPGADAAARWCADIAGRVGAEVVAVYALPSMVQTVPLAGPGPIPVYDEDLRDELRKELDAWCAPLREAGVAYRAEMVDGAAATALDDVAAAVDAEMIVVGRRGHGGFKELVLGSVAHRLSHHSDRPVVIVPRPKDTD